MKSIIQSESKQECCYICGQWAETTHPCLPASCWLSHEYNDGLTVRLCNKCHTNLHDHGAFDRKLQRIAQTRWMEYYEKSEDDFRKRYGKSYL